MTQSVDSDTVSATSERGPWQRYGWLMSVIWLVFLYFPIRALLSSPASEPLLALGWCALIAFAVAYMLGFWLGMRAGWHQPSARVGWLFAIAVLCVALTTPTIGWEATSFLPFLMAYTAYAISATAHWVASFASIAIVGLDIVLSLTTGRIPPWLLAGIVLMMAAVNSINIWMIGRSVVAEELRLELATSEERETIARDVHDLLGHSLTVVKLKAELASRLIEQDPVAAQAELADIARLTGEAIAGVRGTVTGLRAGELGHQLDVSREALEAAGIEVRVEGSVTALSPAQSLPASWVLREATTNILRHARARRVRVHFEPGTLVVEDDGIGVGAKPGNGLRGMAERAAAAGAVLRVARPGPALGVDGAIGVGAVAEPAVSGDAEHTSTGTVVTLTW